MNMRLFKKDLQSRGLSLKTLIAFFEDVKKGMYVKKDCHVTQHDNLASVAYIYQSEIDYISKCILDYKNIETGGQLFGYWTAEGNPVVVYAIGPGPKAKHEVAFFMQDLEYLKSRADLLWKKYGLFHIGEWHSHHQLGLAEPSGHDANNFYTNIQKLGYSSFLLCIGNCTNTSSSLNAFMFHRGSHSYAKTPWIIKNIESPYRKVIQNEELHYFLDPKTAEGNMIGLSIADSVHGSQIISYKSHYWLNTKENRKVLKSIIDSLNQMFSKDEYLPTIDKNNEVHITRYSGDLILEDIYFPHLFPLDPPIVTEKGVPLDSNNLWQYKSDIYKSFFNYYNKIKTI